MEQNPLAVALSFERLAIPARRRQFSGLHMNLPESPACLVVHPAALPVAQPQPGQRQVVAGSGMFRVALDCNFMFGQSLVQAPQIEQGVASVRPRGGAAQRLGPREDGGCLLEPPLGMQQNSVHIHRFGVIGVPPERPARPSPCPGHVFLRQPQLAPRHHRLHLIEIERKGLAQTLLRLFGPVQFPFKQGKIQPACHQVGPQLDRPAERRQRR